MLEQPNPDLMRSLGRLVRGLSALFWGLPLALPELPRLEIHCLNRLVTVSWLRPAEGFLLDETATLAGSPIPWTQVASPYQTNATHISISLTQPTGNRFYRLRKP